MNDAGQTFAGILVGAAVGDALGLPAENLSPARIRAFWGGRWRHRFFLGQGMVSDDTEHAALVAQCLTECRTDAGRFAQALSWKLRLWFACLPPGVGFATARACLKMWLGFGARSGVFSAGNGPSMRAAIIGATFADDEARRRDFVTASTRLTHVDVRADWAAQAVAECAALETSRNLSVSQCRQRLEEISAEPEWRQLMSKLFEQLEAGRSVSAFAESLGLRGGVSGYALHSVPVALFAWLRHRPSFEEAMVSALNCGGDTDSVGAIVGALGGAAVGVQGIPARWVQPIRDWPFSIGHLRKLALVLSGHEGGAAPRVFWPGLLVRNLAVLLIVLFHGFRRLLPPYGSQR